ncbi:MAG: MFS transporter [Chloroflexi bacterium]|nr:MFS transporter [Chloroflexota bacterium]
MLRAPRMAPFGWLAAANFAFGLAMGIYQTIFFNFIGQDLGISPNELGLLETVREIPGLLTAGIAALVMTVAEPVVGAVALLMLGVGFVNYFHIDGIPSLILFSLVASVGFHMWMPISSTLALRLSRVTEQGSRLGRLRAVAAVANLAGIGLVALVAGASGLRPLFVVAGVLAIAGALLVLRVRGVPRTKRPPRILVRRAYGLYYALTFLDGARRHIFMTFALFLLVRDYESPVQTIAILSLINGVVSIAAVYQFGRLIDRFGERRILMVAYGALALIFVGYAAIPVLAVLFVLYVLDNLFFSADTGVTTYLGKIAVDPADIRPSLVTGMTVNHIAAVIIPITGGILWEAYGHWVPFIAGAILAVASLALSSRIRVHVKETAPSPVAKAMDSP